MSKNRVPTLPVLVLTLLAACRPSSEEAPSPAPASPSPLAGTWRAVLASPGGELPFTLEISDEGGKLTAVAVTGEERVPFSAVEAVDDRVVLAFEWYDSEISATLDPGGDTLEGRWRKTVPGGDSTLAFSAHRGDTRRFLPLAEADAVDGAPESIDGHYKVRFESEDGVEPARGEFTQRGDVVTGTFLTPTGDYRYLEGSWEGGVLRLSTFDGAHAFLFVARAQDDGTLAGDFWSRDSYHATWTASLIAADEDFLPDGWTTVGITNDEKVLRFDFLDLEGRSVAWDDPRFSGKVVLVNIFGSWCPNCNDEAPLLARWYKTYHDQGFEVVGLAYEFSGDTERDRRMVQRYARRHGIDFTLLLAGISDKDAASATLPDLTGVLSYPTSIFVGRDGTVRRIFSGFAGPGTGGHHQELVSEVEALIEELLAEPAA